MFISYRFLSCSTKCSNQITSCCAVLRILQGGRAREACAAARTFQFLYARALHKGINQHATTGYVKTALFLQFLTGFIGYYLSWMLLMSHIQESHPYFCSSNNITFPSLAPEVQTTVWFHQLWFSPSEAWSAWIHLNLVKCIESFQNESKVQPTLWYHLSSQFSIMHWRLLFSQAPDTYEKLHNIE